MTQLRRSWYRSAREKHLRTQPIGLQPTPLRHLVVQAPGAPESNRCNRQHHPGQLPVTDFLDHLHHCVTPSWLASHACDTSLLASHMPLGLSENPAILRVVGHKNVGLEDTYVVPQFLLVTVHLRFPPMFLPCHQRQSFPDALVPGGRYGSSL